jgi:two-component system sensor kinase FixL
LDGIITFNEEGTIESMNPAAANLFGCQPQEVIDNSVGMLLAATYGSDYEQIQKYLKKDLAELIGTGREMKGRRKSGEYFTFRFSVSVVEINGRKLFTGILHDLTEQKLAEQKMWQEKERAKKYLDVANTMMVALDKNGRVELFNKKGEEILGYDEAEILGQIWFDLFVPIKSKESVKESFETLMSGEREFVEYFESTLVTKNGKEIIIAWHNSMVYDETGNIAGTMSSGNDVTKQRENEQKITKLNGLLELKVEKTEGALEKTAGALEDAVNKLIQEVKDRKATKLELLLKGEDLKLALQQEKEVGEMKSRFVSMASHEFRTPLSTILSSAALLSRYTKEDQQPRRDKHINKIRLSVQNLNSILNDFLTLSKLEEGKVNVQNKKFAFNEFCQELIAEMRALLQEGQRIKFDGLVNDQFLTTDSRLLKNSLINLLSNALKYSKPNKTIILNGKIDAQLLIIKVIDQGIGIPKKDQPRLFTRFFRAKNVENIKGHGLGLTIVQRYLDLMKGRIEFESEEGVGTTFTLKIPL